MASPSYAAVVDEFESEFGVAFQMHLAPAVGRMRLDGRCRCGNCVTARVAAPTRRYRRSWDVPRTANGKPWKNFTKNCPFYGPPKKYAQDARVCRKAKTAAERSADSYRRLKALVLEVLGPCCVKCGSTENLQADHIDPTSKSFDIGSSGNRREAAIRAELAKCQRLCRPCHNYKTVDDRGFQHASHGNTAMYRGGCRCGPCREANTAYCRAQRGGVRTITSRYAPVVCGTERAYKRGCRCNVCMCAMRARSRQQHAKRKAARTGVAA